MRPGDVTTKVSVSSFQQCDGTNFTTAGIDNSFKAGNGSLGVYTGFATEFNGKPISGIIDFKGSTPYGDSPVSGGFRIRNNIGENSKTVQFRLQPCTVTIPASDKTSIYATPYVATKVNYNSGDAATTVGCFAGVTHKIGKASVFVEGQIYDAGKINANTTSINIGVSIPIN